MEQLVQSAAQNGFFALLFVSLFVYTLRTNEKREQRYQDLINSLAEKLEVINHIKEDVDTIKVCVTDKEGKCK